MLMGPLHCIEGSHAECSAFLRAAEWWNASFLLNEAALNPDQLYKQYQNLG
jgi:hypothetical protein